MREQGGLRRRAIPPRPEGRGLPRMRIMNGTPPGGKDNRRNPAAQSAQPHPRLTVELIPATTWYDNLRSRLTPEGWKRLRKECYRKAGYRCEICGGRGPDHPVECHEIWHFDDDRAVQTLVRLIALCPSCHLVKHFGFASVSGRGEEAFAHLLRVNGWTREQGERHVAEAFRQWETRSRRQWKLDISAIIPQPG